MVPCACLPRSVEQVRSRPHGMLHEFEKFGENGGADTGSDARQQNRGPKAQRASTRECGWDARVNCNLGCQTRKLSCVRSKGDVDRSVGTSAEPVCWTANRPEEPLRSESRGSQGLNED
jgi:hypothetical protein